jgi:amino acid adenylation domain-containing protein/FkbH-like protein
VLQEALNPASESSLNGAGGMNVFLIRPSDLGSALAETGQAIAALAARSSATQLVMLCPDQAPVADLAPLTTPLSGLTKVDLVTAESLADLYPVTDIFDPESDSSGHIPYTDTIFVAAATRIVRSLSLRARPPVKVLALDADNTIWGGICGEDGPAGLRLDGPYRALREFAIRKRAEGLLLVLVSKNQEADVERVFAERAGDLILTKADFSGWKVGWNPKSQSLRELAAELNLGLDSFVFLDDNPAEVAEVAANAPGAIALTLPENAEGIPAFLDHLWPLDTLPTTAEDAARAEFYQQESERRDLRATAPSYAEFLRGLNLRIEIAEATPEDLPRVAQLTLRTNQFNANPLRLSEGDLAERIAAGAKCLSVRVSDRFGNYGLVGAAMHGRVPDAILNVELFLLSCRAMGKGVERVMLRTLAESALAAGAKTLAVAFTETDRNEPVRRFFEGLGGFSLEAAEMAVLSPFPEEAEPTAQADKTAPTATKSRGPFFDAALAARIATELRDPLALHDQLAAAKRPRPEIAQAFVKPGTRTQARLAEIWRGILGLAEVGLEDPFSALGGSSLQLVRLHAALRREFGTALELVELFELPTIAAQAAKLESERRASDEPAAMEETSRTSDDEAVAVIGVALRVPGANDPETFWQNLVEGVESVSFFGPDEIEYPEEFGKPGYVPAKGLVDDIDKFDAAFFGILPKDAKIMDPQQRIFLELAWEAMERSGYTPETHRQRIGIYAGAYFDTYLLTNLCTDREFLADLIPQIQVGSLQCELGNDKDYLATRVAFKMNLRGPAMTLQTACSTSMVAIIEACRAIRSGLCDMALAGGITLTLPLKRGYFYTEQGMLSGDGHCRAYDEKATGTVFGNGAGVVMLKRLSDAIRDRDHIHAVIRGTGMNNDGGVKHSYTAPSVEGQVDVIRMAHRDAGVEASSIGYIEGHGTGTPLGDPIEVTALTKAFRAAGVSENQFCALGSLKTNIGHLDVASGVCGLIKTALSLEKATLPPILHYQSPNPKIDFANSPFYVNAKLTPWTEGRHGQPRRAGISAFGVGGTNAHVILEEAPAVVSTPSPRANQLFLLSARTEEALAAAATNLANFAASPGETKSADAAWTLAIGRKPFRCRRAVTAPDFASLAEALRSGAGVSGVADRSNPPVHFLFPGQGSQHVNMGRAFYESEPRFREALDRCSEMLRPHLGLSLTEVLYPAEGADLEAAAEQLKHTVLAQPAIFVIEYALADLWRHWGLAPAAMVGHSVGEFVAACHAGVFSLEDGLRLLAARGRLMGELPGGGMLSVRLPESDLLARLPETLDLAAVNGPSLCVVAGPREELEIFRAALEAEGVPAQTLHTSHAFHSRMMDPVIETFADEFAGIELRGPSIPILSTVTGEWLTEKETCDPLYWAKHLREPVRFHRSVVALGARENEQLFLEVGPGSTLAGLVRQSLDRKSNHLALSTCRHVKEPGCDHANALETLGRLWAAGVEVDWEAFYAAESRKRVPLPTYPFERKRHWVDPKPLTDAPRTYTAPIETAAPESAPIETIMSTPEPACRRPALAAAIRAVLADLSGMSDEELVGDASYLELGFDSLLLTQVSKALGNEFGIGLTLRDLMGELSSIDALVAHLDATLPVDRYAPEPAPSVDLAPAVPVAAVNSAPAAPVNGGTAAAPSVASVMVPAAVPTLSVNASGLEGVIAQQLELMRQQIALLQGGSAAQAPNPIPDLNPAPAALSAKASTPAAPQPAKASTPTTDSTANVSAPTTSINRNLDDTLSDRQQRHLDELVAKYVAKTRTSKELTAKYRQWHADPRTVSGFNRRWKEMIYQIAVVKSKGSRLLDVDGNEYIDLLNGFGPNFLGHSPDFVTEALKEQLDRGVEVGPQCVNAMEAAQLFCEITGNERASFVNTGSEAVQAAMRLARTVTGRDKIVIFTKDYHGNFDEVLVKGVGSGDSIRSLPIAPGIPRRAVDDMIVLPYGTDEALEIIRARAHEVAAVIVEPIQSRRPEFQPREFIREVREITRQSGSVFVFDEVITGFRTGPHGAQEFYGVEADLATYGKVVGGGMPLGVVAGKAEFMDTFDGGMWQYGDDSFPEKGVTFFAGTFVRHPLAMAAVKEVLLHLKGKGPEFWQGVKDRATRLATTVDRMFVENNAPFRMPNFGSQMFVRAAEDHKYANLLFFHLRNKGVFLLEGFPTYMTAAHTDEDIDYCIAAFRESVAELQDGGFFDVPSGIKVPHLNGGRLTGPKRLLGSEVGGRGSEVGSRKSEVANPQPEASGPVAIPNPKSEIRNPKSPSVHPMTEPLAEVWLASQISGNASLCFNEINLVTLRGPLDAKVLGACLNELVVRHDALRAVFPAGGEGFVIQPSLAVDLTLSDLSSLTSSERDQALAAAEERERETVFDLEKGPLFRASLLRLAPEEHVLVLNAHHIVCDGWSYNVLLAELAELYRARAGGPAANLPPAPSFAAHCDRVAAREADPAATPAEAHWMKEFAESVEPLDLPLDLAAPAEPDFLCGTLARRLGPEKVRALRKVAGKSGATLFGLLLGAYQILLHRIAGRRRFVVGFPAAGQNGSGEEGLVGHCVNFLPFVAAVDPGEGFGGFLKTTQRRLLDALDHQEFTYGRLLKKFGPENRPRVEAVFNLERVDDGLDLPGLATEVAEIERGYAANPIFLKAREYEAGLEIRFDYQSSLFAEGTVEQWLETYVAILEEILDRPEASVSELSAALSPAQRELLRSWNDTATAYPRDRGVPELFEETARRRGTATAIRHEGGETSYAELAELVDRLSRSLADAGIGSGDRVALLLCRTPELVAAMLAVLKCGAAYVPLDPDYPAERLRLMLEDSGAGLVLVGSALADRVPKGPRLLTVEEAAKRGRSLPAAPVPAIGADDPAYVIYTSGSTGAPKGTVIPHRGIVRLVRETGYCRFGEDEVVLQAATVCFDASVYEIYGALLNGGVLSLPPTGPLDVETLARTIRGHGVTQLFLTTGLFQILVDERPEAFAGVGQVLTGGDIVSPGHMRRFLEAHPGCRLVHCYGPTENTTFTTCRDVVDSDFCRRTIPVGGPIANSTVWILDEAMRPTQPGVVGELFTGGEGVGLGYLGNPEATAAKFIDDPFSDQPGAKLYRSGDLARLLPDGSVEFSGRIDHQVKIRGFRVEPGEIESQLGRHPGVRQAKVVVKGAGAGDKVLVAYAGAVPGAAPTPEALSDFLRGKLPAYMIPSAIVVLDELPLNPSGKVDTKALPNPAETAPTRDDDASRERRDPTPTEAELLGLWRELLGASVVGLDDDFFALGGHSLLGMRLFARIQKSLGVSLPLAVLFKAPTVRLLASTIDQRLAPVAPPQEPELPESPEVPKEAAVAAVAAENDETPEPSALSQSGIKDAHGNSPKPVPDSAAPRGGFHLASSAFAAAAPLAETTVAIQPKGDLPPLFAVHGGDGGVLFYGQLAERLGEGRPFYAFEAPALTATSPIPEETVEETAAHYLVELRKVQQAGPYHLCGYSFGGVVAYEMARQLSLAGEEVEFLGLVDTENPSVEARKLSLGERIAVNWKKPALAEKGALEKVGHVGMRFGTGLAYRLYFEAEDAVARVLPEAKGAGWLRQVQLRKAHERAMESYVPGPFPGRLTLFRAIVGGDKFEIGEDYGWNELVDELEIVEIPGNHVSVFHKENIDAIAEAFRNTLSAVAAP